MLNYMPGSRNRRTVPGFELWIPGLVSVPYWLQTQNTKSETITLIWLFQKHLYICELL